MLVRKHSESTWFCAPEDELMSWSDPIVEEVRRVREAYAARFNYDLRAIYRDLKEREKRGGRKIAPGPTEPELNETGQSSEPAVAVPEDVPSSKHEG